MRDATRSRSISSSPRWPGAASSPLSPNSSRATPAPTTTLTAGDPPHRDDLRRGRDGGSPAGSRFASLPVPDPEPGAVVMAVHLSGDLRHRQTHLSRRVQAVRGNEARARHRVPADLRSRERGTVDGRRRPGVRQRTESRDQGRRPDRARGERPVRPVLLLRQRLPVLLLPGPRGLREQPQPVSARRGCSAAGPSTCTSCRDAAVPGPGRASRTRSPC